MTAMTAAIEVSDLRKVYGERAVVDGVSLRIDPGEVYALLGHNGAGKSTTVEILEGYRPRTAGMVSVLGVDPADGGSAWRDRLGIVLQTSGIEPALSVREAIEIYGSAYQRRRSLDVVAELTGLTDQLDQRIGTLSGGQRRRIDLALGIVGTPDVLFLDEPTTGFDPAARRSAWEVVRQLGAGGTTVLLTTHYLDEAEYLADRVGVIADGRMIAEGTPGELIGANTATIVRGASCRPAPSRRELDRHRAPRGAARGRSDRVRHVHADRSTCTVSAPGRSVATSSWPTSPSPARRWRTPSSPSPPTPPRTAASREPLDPSGPLPTQGLPAQSGGGVLHLRPAADDDVAVQRAVR